MIYNVENMTEAITYDLLDKVIVFSYEYLGILYDTNLEIEFDDDMPDCQSGSCDIEDGVAEIYLNPNMEREELITTIFHEMVHIRQMLNGDLVGGEGFEPSAWRGVKYNMQYKDLPWEKEAFELEKIMMEKFYAD